MALSNSILLIRDYENIRRILRDIYVYGCFSRDDFVEKGISGRKYDNEQRRINAYLPEHFIQKRRNGKKVLQFCSYHIEESYENYLADTFRNKSFTALDIMAYFFVQQILHEEGPLSLTEILESLPVLNDEVVFTKDNLRVKLEELREKGYIVSGKDGKNVIYSLPDDIWCDFTDDELKDILLYLDYKKNSSPLEMPYYFLYKKMKLYLFSERGISADESELFQFKHNHRFNVLDNDIMMEILQAINQGKILWLRGNAQGSERVQTLCPVEIIHDSIYGRQYLVGITEQEKSRLVLRLDRIVEVKSVRDFSEDEVRLVRDEKEKKTECWCTAVTDGESEEIVIRFSFDENTESYVLRRIIQEGHGGTLEKVDTGQYIYRNKFSDLREVVPWIRSFGERAKVISGGGIEQLIAQDWDKAVKRYEAFRRNGK